MRLAYEELGLVFIKFGQLLSTRYDILPKEDCEELQQLLDRVPSIPLAAVEAIFMQDFGKRPQDVYAEFLEAPIASASIAQVYRARLADGREVAVKVRRPGVGRAIRADLRILRRLAGIAQWFSGGLRQINVCNLLDQMESWLLAEVDFQNELLNLEQFTRYYRSQPEGLIKECADALVLPAAHREWCSKNIITMDFITGVPIRQFRSVEQNAEYDVFASLRNFTGAFMRGWMYGEELVFQADPHPSNLLILPQGKIAVLDFGLLGRLSKREIGEMKDLFLAVYAGNLEQSIVMALRMCRASYDHFAPLIREDVQRYLAETRTSGMGFWFLGFVKIFVKHRIGTFPYYLAMFGRMGAIFEGLFEMVSPGTTMMEVFGGELGLAMRQRFIENLKATDVTPLLYVLSEKLRESPEKIAALIDRYFDDPLAGIREFRKAVQV